MAVTITKVTGADRVEGNVRIKVRDLVFSSNYAASGEVVTAASVGLKRIYECQHGAVALATATTTGDIVHSTVGATGADVTFTFLQTGTAADAPLNEKGAEAHVTGAYLRATFIGY